MSNEIVPYTAGMDLQSLGTHLARSGYFRDAADASKAIVKVLYGAELGFPPVTSMMGIHIIEGKPSYSAHIMAAAVKRSGRYSYRVREASAKRAAIEFFEGAESLGIAEFTIEEAASAGLAAKTVWKQYPKAMLFSRAMSAGFRMFTPDLSGGAPAYTPEELGAEVDGETGEIIESTARPAPDPRTPAAPMLQHQAIAAIAAASCDRRDDLYEADTDSLDDDAARRRFWAEARVRGYERQADVHRLLGLPETQGALKDYLQSEQKGWRWAKGQLARLDEARGPFADEQGSLSGMPAVERERPEAAAGAH